MYIAGIQKLSLVDYPEKVACTLFTGGCNLRCPFCHNSELLEGPMPSVDVREVLDYLDERKGVLDAVVVSGGEPCMQPDLLEFLQTLKQKNLLVKLDTNGCYPAVLRQALQKGLVDYVAMDLKSDPAGYAAAAGSENVPLAAITESVELLLTHSIPFELRTTVVVPLHTEQNFLGMADYLSQIIHKFRKEIPNYYLQSFKDRDTVPFAGFSAPDKTQLEAYGRIMQKVACHVGLRGV